MLLAPVLMTALALTAPRPAPASDAGSLVAGTVLGMLMGGAFDRDYPRGFSFNYSGEPTWYYYPSTGAYAFPPDAGPYPYNQRWWESAGNYEGRPVYVPARYPGSGERQALRYTIGNLGPIFLMPTDSRWGGSDEYCATCMDNRIEPRLFGQYRWEPSLELGTYRRPPTGWYNGPGPDWYAGRDQGQRPALEVSHPARPDNQGAGADRGQAGQGRSDQSRSSTTDRAPAAARDGSRSGDQPQQQPKDSGKPAGGKGDGGGDKRHGD